jgi:hypothetical protein
MTHCFTFFKEIGFAAVLRIRDKHPGSQIRIFSIPDPDLEFLPTPDPGIKKAPDSQLEQ